LKNLLELYGAWLGKGFSTFRKNVSSSTSRIKSQRKIYFWTLNFCLKDIEPLKIKAVRSTETSQTTYSAPQRHNAKERNNWLHGREKNRKSQRTN